MNKLYIRSKLKEFSIFFWLIGAMFIALSIYKIYEENSKQKTEQIYKILDNLYFKKTIKNITSNLDSRYFSFEYKAKPGDTYEKIIDYLEINNNERKLLLKSILNNKSLKTLKTNQKFNFKIDKLNKIKVIELRVETDKKNEIVFAYNQKTENYLSKKIQKNFQRNIVYKEAVITNSLYNSALNINIKPNIIIEFARIYGFQVDFQRDIWKNDSFQIIYEEFKNTEGKIIDTGEIIFANLKLQDTDLQLYRYEYEKGKVDYFDENGKSIKKTLMKTPINGARLSSSFGKRKHPILGYTKMHTGTDFAAPTGTPIMASGDGIVTKASWCGGGGNCVKIKHNSKYQTIYAHMSKFAKGIKKGKRVKQGQIIGYVGSTGLSTGPHLHYEVIENGRKINSQKLKLPSGKILKNNDRKNFEVSKIKIDVLKSDLITNLN